MTIATASPGIPQAEIDRLMSVGQPTAPRRQVSEEVPRNRPLRRRFMTVMREILGDAVEDVVSPF